MRPFSFRRRARHQGAIAAACLAALVAGCAQLPGGQKRQLDRTQFAAIDAAIQTAIAERRLPGAVFHLEREGAVHARAYGRLSYEPGAAPVTMDTVFDAASLSKDPTVRRIGGVAGSAGVFSTVGDIARYARMLLGGGELDGVRVLSPESVRLLTTVQSPPGIAALRGLGMDIDSPFAQRPRGTLFPVGSFGHTGFTGCVLWIDPGSRSLYVFLSNRVYPDDKGNVLPLYTEIATLSARAAGLGTAPPPPGAAAP
jgi:CubicO group peptidase (beta-lactamase class C family)